MSECAEATKRFFRSGPATISSDVVRWESLLVREAVYRTAHEINLPEMPDLRVAFIRNEIAEIETLRSRSWQSRAFPKGTGLVDPPHAEVKYRWDPRKVTHFSIRGLFVPQETLESVKFAVQRPGHSQERRLEQVALFNDPLLANFAGTIVAAIQAGAPDFYAQASAQWIAAHLLLGRVQASAWRDSLDRERIRDTRLMRVLEYIEANFDKPLTLDSLAGEAGISPFHFARLFGKAVGVTPHRHLLEVRLRAAARMLKETDKSILDIALTCGFNTSSHFSAAFRKQYGWKPKEFAALDSTSRR